MGLRSIMSVSLADRSVSSLTGTGTGNEAGTGAGVVVDTGDATSVVGEAMRKRGGKHVLLPRAMCTSNSAGKRLQKAGRQANERLLDDIYHFDTKNKVVLQETKCGKC